VTEEQWLNATFDTTSEPKDLTNSRAIKLLSLVTHDGYGGVALYELKSNSNGQEVVVLDLEIPLGQKDLINDIRSHERIAIVFGESDHQPLVIPLRNGFPDVSHLNAVPPGAPRTLCIYEEPWSEIKLQWTPLSFLERVRRWFEKTAYDELHADDQPLDPFFLGGSLFTVVVPPLMLAPDHHKEFFVSSVVNEDKTELWFLEDGRAHAKRDSSKTAVALVINTQAVPQGRLHYAPTTLQELVDADETLGPQIVSTLQDEIKNWVEQQSSSLDKPLLILLRIPLQRHSAAEPEKLSTYAFMSNTTAGQIGAAIGVTQLSPDSNQGHWAMILGDAVLGELSGIHLQTGDVRMGFSTALAAESSGTEACSI